MVDASLEIQESLDFHQCDIPHGMKEFVLEDLTKDQQSKLNTLKRNYIREDQIYLSNHPEIRAVISLILRLIMRRRPIRNVELFIGSFFKQCSNDIREYIKEYLQEREKTVCRVRSSTKPRYEKFEQKKVSIFGDEQKEIEGIMQQMESVQVATRILEQVFEKAVGVVEQESKTDYEIYMEYYLERQRQSLLARGISSNVDMCREILEEVVNDVVDYMELPGTPSMESAQMAEDYEDHAVDESIATSQSSEMLYTSRYV